MATWEDPHGEPDRILRGPTLGSAAAGFIVLALSGVALAASIPIVRQADFIRQRTSAPQPAAQIEPQTQPQFVVLFGEFASRAEAHAYARTVRGKGYLATVLQDVTSFRVISRPYDTREDADFWRSVFEDIGLDSGTTEEISPSS